MVEKFEIIATNLIQQQNFTELRVIQNQTVLIAQKVIVDDLKCRRGIQPVIQLPLANLTIKGKTYSTVDNTQTQGGSTNTTLPPMLTASVVLPPSMFSSIAVANSNILTNIGIFFSTYKTASLFPLTNASNNITVIPHVIGVTIVAGMTNNLTDPIVISFTIPNMVRYINDQNST